MATYVAVFGTDAAWNTTTNWSPNGTPGANDTIIIDNRLTRNITGSPSGSPQLTRIAQYLNAAYKFGTPASPIAVGATTVDVGLPSPDGSTATGGEFHISVGTNSCTLNVYNTPTQGTAGQEPCTIKTGTPGTSNSLYTYGSAIVGVASGSAGDTATISTIVAQVNSRINFGVGNTVTWTNIQVCDAATVYTQGGSSGTVTLFGGSVVSEGTSLIATATIYGGTFFANHRVSGGNSFTTVNMRGGTLDIRGDGGGITIGTYNWRAGRLRSAQNGQATITTLSLDQDVNAGWTLSVG